MAGFTFTPLTPSAYLDRAAWVFRDRTAVVDGERSFTYAEFADRAHRLAGALLGLGVPPGGRVAALCVNSHIMLELHNGVPLAGAVLVPLNIRLSRDELTYIVRHSGARILVATAELADVATDVAAAAGARLVIAGGEPDEYEALLASARPAAVPCEDERGLLAINYTSGTTGRPKGVMYHHRGAYLQALGDRASAARPPQRLPVDAADVPLQRLVLHVGGHRGRRHSRVPARRRAARIWDCIRTPRASPTSAPRRPCSR